MYKRKEEKWTENKQNQSKLASHDLRSSLCLLFALKITKASSLLNVALHIWTDGSSPLKIHEFLSTQMLQHIMIMISIAKGIPRVHLIRRVALSGLNQVGTTTPISCQQFWAKEHLKNNVS
jgi:hypothetical protein